MDLDTSFSLLRHRIESAIASASFDFVVPACSRGGTVFYGPPCNMSPLPLGISFDGAYVYANPVQPKVSPISYDRDGKPLYERNEGATKEDISSIATARGNEAIGFSQSGLPFYLPEGGKLPKPSGCTESGVLFYSALAICESGKWKQHAGGRVLQQMQEEDEQADLKEDETKITTEEWAIDAGSKFEEIEDRTLHHDSIKLKLVLPNERIFMHRKNTEKKNIAGNVIKFDHTM